MATQGPNDPLALLRAKPQADDPLALLRQPAQTEHPGGVRRLVNIAANYVRHPIQSIAAIYEANSDESKVRLAQVLTGRAKRFFGEQFPAFMRVVAPGYGNNQMEAVNAARQVGETFGTLTQSVLQTGGEIAGDVGRARGVAETAAAIATPVLKVPLFAVDMITTPVADLLEARTGVNMSDKFGTIVPYTAEKRADLIQMTAGNIAAFAAGASAEQAIAKNLTNPAFRAIAEKGIGQVDDAIVAAAASGDGGLASRIGRAAVSGAGGGAVGGAAFAVGAEAGKDDLGTALTTYVVAGAGLGMSISTAIAKWSPAVNNSEAVALARRESTIRAKASLRSEAAEAVVTAAEGNIAGQARQLNATEVNTLPEAVANALALNQGPDELAKAVLVKGAMVPGHTIVNGASEQTARLALNIAQKNDIARLMMAGMSEADARLVARARVTANAKGKIPNFLEVAETYEGYDPYLRLEKGSSAYIYKNADGTYKILISNDVAPLRETQIMAFQRYGHLPGEQVSFRGKNYRIVRPLTPEGKSFVVTDGVNQQILGRDEFLSTQFTPLTTESIADALEKDFLQYVLQEAESKTKPTGRAPAPVQVKSHRTGEWKMPKHHEKDAPKFGPPGRKGPPVPIKFGSDFDRAAYIIASRTGKESTKKTLMDALAPLGITSREDIKAHAALLRERAKNAWKANPAIKQIDLPATPFYGVQATPSITDAAVGSITTLKSFAELVAEFGRMYDITDAASLRALESGLGLKIGPKLEALLDPKEVAQAKKLNAEVQATLIEARKSAATRDVDNFIDAAQQNGMFVDRGGPGVYVLRDVETGVEMKRSSNIRELNDFIVRSRQTSGAMLDGGSNGAGVPPTDVLQGRMVNGDSPITSHIIDDGTNFEALRANPVFGDTNPYVTKAVDYFKQIDRSFKEFGLNLKGAVYDALDVVVNKLIVEQKVWEKNLKHLNDLLGKRSQSRRELIFDYIQTESPENIIVNGVRKGIPLTPVQAQWGLDLSKFDFKKIQLATVAKRAMMAVGETQQGQGQYQALVAKLGLSPEEVGLVNELVSRQDFDNLQLRDIFVLAEAYKGDGIRPTMTKEAFAKFHKLDPLEIEVANRLTKEIYEPLAQERGVAELNNYITHRRTAWETPDIFSDFEQMVGKDNAYFELTRQGLLDVYERDPIRATQQYIYAHLYTKYYVPGIKSAEASLAAELAKGSGEKFMQIAPEINARAQAFFQDLLGREAHSQGRMVAFATNLMKKLGIKDGVKSAERIKALYDTSFQGARISAGLRDVASATINYYPVFGERHTARFVRLMLDTSELSKETVQRLADEGIVRGFTVNAFDTPGQGSVLQRLGGEKDKMLAAVHKKGLELSGQPYVHSRVQAATYIQRKEAVSAALGEFAKDGNIGKLVEAIDLDWYEVGQRLEFEKILNSKVPNAAELATDYLAKETVKTLVGRFGYGNNPMGWRGTFGRLVSHYGQWTTQHKSYVLQLTTNGTGWKGRYGRIARYTAANSALLLSKPISGAFGLGLNLSYYAPILGMGFTGGPVVEAATDVVQGNLTEQMLPWNNRGRHSYIPFSYAMSDYYRALEATFGGNPVEGAAIINRTADQ